MKSVVNFPEEVTVSLSSMPIVSCEGNTTKSKTLLSGANSCDSDAEETTASSFVTESESDSDSEDTTGVSEDENYLCSDDESISRTNRRVSFGPIHVRQYERIIGDHPLTKVGVPLGIGWAYYEDERHPQGVSIERYESDRIRRGTSLRATSITRKNILQHVFLIPEEELVRAEAQVRAWQKKTKNQSEKTQTLYKRMGKKIRKGGMAFLKGMSHAVPNGTLAGGSESSSSSSSNLSLAIGHMF